MPADASAAARPPALAVLVRKRLRVKFTGPRFPALDQALRPGWNSSSKRPEPAEIHPIAFTSFRRWLRLTRAAAVPGEADSARPVARSSRKPRLRYAGIAVRFRVAGLAACADDWSPPVKAKHGEHDQDKGGDG